MKYYLDIEVLELNMKCLIQIRQINTNFGQGKIKKILKTMYHLYYKGSNYSVKKVDLLYNIYYQVCVYENNLKKIK